ncbi:MAG: CsbD family protein [Gammaproteobacteria bacterium]|nr:CsbD family protein [Gammaproteobacteria bacterium]
MNSHQLKGRISQATGKLKEITGKLFGNKSLEAKGRAKKTGGKIQAGYGDIKDDTQKHV